MHARVAGRSGFAALVVLFLVGCLVVGPGGLGRADAAEHPRRTTMLTLTNDDRAERGRARLSLNERVSRYAKRHSREMAQRGYLFHSTSARLIGALSRYEWSVGGENVGVGGSLDDIESAFMASKDHRRNILRRRFDHVAIGVVSDAGTYWVTVIFYG